MFEEHYKQDMNFLIDCFIINPNIKMPKEIKENDLFWFKLIEKEPTYIKYVPKYLQKDLLELL